MAEAKSVQSLMKTLIVGLIGASLFGCAVAIPVHEDNSAQTLGKGKWDVALLGGAGPTVGPRNFPSGSQPGAGVFPQMFTGFRVARGITKTYDAELEADASVFGGGEFSLAVIHQWYGPSYFETRAGDNYAGMRFRYTSASGYEDNPSTWSNSSSDSTFGNNIFVSSLNADTLTFANSWGHATASWFGVYAGLEAGTSHLRAQLRDGGPTGTPYSDDRYAFFGGPLAGFSLHSTGQTMRVALTFEIEYLSVPNTFTNGNKMGLFASEGLHFTF